MIPRRPGPVAPLSRAWAPFLACGLLAAAPPPETVPPEVRKETEAFLQETPRTRILRRNIFHPTRGFLNASPASPGTLPLMPTLRGTVVHGRRRGALLQWTADEEGLFLLEGETRDGFTLVKVEATRAQIQRAPGGETRWLDLVEPASAGSPGAPPSDYEGLLAPPRPEPAPAPR